MSNLKGVFLTAEWHRLVMLNYPIDPAVLLPYTPRGTEIDAWQGTTFVSLVGFLFLDTRVTGFRVPQFEVAPFSIWSYSRAVSPTGPGQVPCAQSL